MDNYVIEGGKRLEGEVIISGAKNAALPIIAATILNREEVEIDNCPNIHDVLMMIDILKVLGCDVHRDKNKIIVNSSKLCEYEIPENLMREMRSSVIFAGALLGRTKRCVFTYPGGCDF